MVCYNGRFNWIPYLDFIIDFYQRRKLGQNDSEYDSAKLTPLDYEDITAKFCCTELRVNFKFSDESMGELIKKLIALPNQTDYDKRLTVVLGASVNDISLQQLIDLMKASKNKVNLDLSGTDLQKKFDKDKTY